MSKVVLSAALSVLLGLAASSCVDDGPFTSCPFDDKIQAVCNASGTGSELSCVVESHPQCPKDGMGASPCLSWRGDSQTKEGVCTTSCTPSSSDCPSGSKCTPFDESAAKYFCVEDERLAK